MKKSASAPIEVVDELPEVHTQIVQVTTGMEPAAVESLQLSFRPHFLGAKKIIEKSRHVVVTDVSQKTEIKVAREYRLALKNIRVDSDKTRKTLKENSLRTSRAIDGFNNILLELIEPEENRLEDQEKFAERKEEERKNQLKLARESELAPFEIDTSFYALSEMPAADYGALLSNLKAAQEAKLAAVKKAEEDRIAKEKENEKIRLENERLKKEAAKKEVARKAELAEMERQANEEKEKARKEKEAIEAAARQAAAKAKAEKDSLEAKLSKEKADAAAKAAEEKKKADLKAKQEREAREKLEAELAAARQAEADKLEAEEEARAQAEAAPDKEKLLAFATSLRQTNLQMKSAKGKKLAETIKIRLDKFAASVEENAANL